MPVKNLSVICNSVKCPYVYTNNEKLLHQIHCRKKASQCWYYNGSHIMGRFYANHLKFINCRIVLAQLQNSPVILFHHVISNIMTLIIIYSSVNLGEKRWVGKGREKKGGGRSIQNLTILLLNCAWKGTSVSEFW